ncbi:MAG: hypothetical protein EPN91_10755 [Salinibacterium sp.]|nr:MAG: hypothetical protein EPN91_10755 [Salinibacterium sp.]
MKPTLLELAEAEQAAATLFAQHVGTCPVCRPPGSIEPVDALCAMGDKLVKTRNELTSALLMTHAFPTGAADA